MDLMALENLSEKRLYTTGTLRIVKFELKFETILNQNAVTNRTDFVQQKNQHCSGCNTELYLWKSDFPGSQVKMQQEHLNSSGVPELRTAFWVQTRVPFPKWASSIQNKNFKCKLF